MQYLHDVHVIAADIDDKTSDMLGVASAKGLWFMVYGLGFRV